MVFELHTLRPLLLCYSVLRGRWTPVASWLKITTRETTIKILSLQNRSLFIIPAPVAARLGIIVKFAYRVTTRRSATVFIFLHWLVLLCLVVLPSIMIPLRTIGISLHPAFYLVRDGRKSPFRKQRRTGR